MVYIGIDIAKYKHFASVVSSDGEVIVKPFSFENSREGFMKLVEEIENFHDCLIGLESTGHYAENLIFFLYQRGYKKEVWEAPLKENLAAALLILSWWKVKAPFIDPFCWSWTIAIEAALMAKNIAPWTWRKFNFEYFKNFEFILK